MEALKLATQESNNLENLLLQVKLVLDNDTDYIIIDTRPGIRYWSINTITLSEITILTLKMCDLDIGDTKKLL